MRRWLPLALLLGLLPALAWGQTFLRDDTGAVAPPVVFTGSGGAQTTVQGTDPLPVTGATSTPTSSTTDPSGWGRRWFLASITFGTANNEAAAFFSDDQTAFVMAQTVTSTAEVFRSSSRGSAFTSVGTTTVGLAEQYYVFRTSAGSYLLVGMGSSITTTGPFRATNPSGPWTVATIPGGVPTNSRANGGIAQQASTLLLGITDPGVDQGHILRSTNDGVSWTTLVSPTLQGFTVNPGVNTLWNSASVASPALNVWLAIDNDGRIFRSTNDGLTFAQTQQIGAPTSNTFNGVVCVSATICVAWNSTQVWRSTNAGETWTQVATLSVAPRIMASLGSGVVIAASSVDATTELYRSGDSGLTWEQLPAVVGPGGGCINGNYTSASVARNGAVVLGFDCNNPGAAGRAVLYSPIVGGGQVGVTGANGVQWDIDSAGGGRVYQGAGAANSGTLEAWQTTPVQRGTLANSQTTGAADTAVTVTIAAVASERAHVYKLTARCSAGTSALTVASPSGTTIWSTPAAAVGTANFTEAWDPGLTGATNTAVVITLATCGVGNTGTLAVQTDRF